ncbi:c-type cytochrome, methanol metabolism-related [Methylobacterium haplocladii]|uniref:C-type cytochrome, methanol metabolism-related n=2 Tax=Methylobacterium haplocladii TaxID=1176176 RepID=A0A512ITD0_9HYPH|nr:c-type cytochrome, methanol metabolism-related [Methylobacterium haplocladii]GJD84907.1 hypothetical protein HPGCJGGD_2790 [Methylobacterium haplocladii]GLS59828.1 c-type cytochrome, methanol metabolism-related [Methylobacterium haplocladii]
MRHGQPQKLRKLALLAAFAAASGLAMNAAHAEPKKPAKTEDGKYLDADGHPTYNISDEGKKVDWLTYSGYRRYHAECHTCHGPDGAGSTYAPALAESLKTLTYDKFQETVMGGKQDVNASENKVMPAFGGNKNVACYVDDLYVYLKARADDAWGRQRPGGHEDKPGSIAEAEKGCLGS